MPSQAAKYRFGPYELRTRTRELYKQGVKLKLRPQPLQVLEILVEHAGDVVTREGLRDRLWSKETFVDFEHGLYTAIKELRGVLSESASEPRYIETLPKLGYRMIIRVEVDELLPVNYVTAQPQTGLANLAGKNRFIDQLVLVLTRQRWLVFLGISVVLMLALGTHFWRLRSRGGPNRQVDD
jgi:DNA-binding winged helix-turn-helix (wHTH) protein